MATALILFALLWIVMLIIYGLDQIEIYRKDLEIRKYTRKDLQMYFRRRDAYESVYKEIKELEGKLDLYKEGKLKVTEEEIKIINGVCIFKKGYLQSLMDEKNFYDKL